MTPSEAMGRFIQERLAAILRRPDGWGPPHAVELQLLLLIEMWHVVQGAPMERVDRVTERYDRFLGTTLPGGPPVPLAVRLGLDQRATEQFVEILRTFLRQEQELGRARVHRTARTPGFPATDRLGPHHLAEA